jgi:putative glutamine amidotransferase
VIEDPKTRAPLVAVVAYRLADDRVPRWTRGGYGVPLPYVDCLREAGARTAIVAPGEIGDAEELLEPFDGLVLVGGGDLHPATYGGDPDEPNTYDVSEDRDTLEIDLVRAADRLRMPALCICRGMQALNVAYGGTLHQHLPAIPGLLEHGVPVQDTESLHDVDVETDSLLMATTREPVLRCSSHHHQGVDRVGDGLRVSGRSRDGLVEAIEVVPDDEDDWARWIVGVQWHPEDTVRDDPAQRSLFEALVQLARIRSTRASASRPASGRSYAIVDPDPSWPERFEEEAAGIREALGDLAVRIDHVGSTAVPGLRAKPIIDVQVSLRSMSPRAPWRDALVAAGYAYRLDPTSVDHEFVSRDDADGTRLVNVHLCPAGSEWERRHLWFRDRLRAHPDERDAYAALKDELAARHPDDVHTYSDAKTAFIRSVEAAARDETAAAPVARG